MNFGFRKPDTGKIPTGRVTRDCAQYLEFVADCGRGVLWGEVNRPNSKQMSQMSALYCEQKAMQLLMRVSPLSGIRNPVSAIAP